MSEADVIDAEVVPADPSREVVPAAQAIAVTPQVPASELVARLSVIREAQEKAMVQGVDYGVIPGTNKPTLLKPGAEKLGVLFQLDIQLAYEKTWGPGDHLTVVCHATVFHAPTGARLGCGEGTCSTRERKYGQRKQERTCPSCGVAAVSKGKQEFGGGWFCAKKRDGCGAKFQDGDQSIEAQQVGQIENPDLPDQWNTVIKMAGKRARVDAVLAVTGASALFTQDTEDHHDPIPAARPGWASDASDDRRRLALDCLTYLYGDSPSARDQARVALASVKERLGVFPEAIVVSLSTAAKTLQEARELEAQS